jgi:hypothetical protein
MKTWNVTVRVRNLGAIGIFWNKSFIVQAEGDYEARLAAIKKAVQEGYETSGTGNPISLS